MYIMLILMIDVCVCYWYGGVMYLMSVVEVGVVCWIVVVMYGCGCWLV